MNTFTRFFTILILCTVCFSCGSGKGDSDIQDSFIGSVQFGQQKQTVLNALYAQQFVDAASGKPTAISTPFRSTMATTAN